MGAQTDPLLLRPLSIGEIFDRAITLLVRNWVPFTIVGALAVLPSHICMYLSRTVSPYWMFAYFGFSLLLIVATMASARIVAQIYRREQIDWQDALGTGFSRLFSAIGANITILLIALLPLLLVVGIPAGLGVFRFSNLLSDGIALLAALCGAAIYLGFNCADFYAINAIAIDGLRTMDSVGRGLALFSRTMAARTLIFALAQATIIVGGSFAGGAIGVLMITVLHNAAIGTIVETIVVFFTSVYGNVITSVFYFDVAIRNEGYDMQMALDAMPG